MDTNPERSFEEFESIADGDPPSDRSAVLIVVPFFVSLLLALGGTVVWIFTRS